ncbi:dynein heavy chain 8, axonemal-like [Lingula anatina]|uniref:Dynein heavy chain 8, axonemal-like n=1 Tax=Lingula anatina TaxID=7574 RepID=A0A2R2MP90_LINAN|nr:dynein heavy chain 8, axonemal-like [Lingula anatina]|eukprot:XP_023932050.1 dynein heavy chain 8, axonemal-like [Lingula anatina]
MLLRQSNMDIPILLMYTDECETAETLFSDFALRKQSRTRVLTVSDPASEKHARKYMIKGMKEGLWVLLHNAHNSPHLLQNIEAILEENLDTMDPQFRCWISVQAGHPNVPVRILQNTVKVLVDSPKIMKDNLIRAFSWVDADILKQSSRPEWPAFLHNICYLHGTIRLRARFGKGGWNNHEDFLKIGNNELFEALALAITEFRDNLTCIGPDGSAVPRNTSWNGIRYMLSEVIYGSYVSDPYDQQTLSAIIDYWISPNATKKDFELARLKYRHPQAFFAPHIRLNALMSSLEGIPNHFLDVPEACHLHQSSEYGASKAFYEALMDRGLKGFEVCLLGDDQYVFTRLNRVFDNMPQSENLSHKLFPRPPTPFEGPPIAQVSMHSLNPQIVNMGVFATASFAAMKLRKDVELWEICHTTIPKVPKAFSKEYVLEKIKKNERIDPEAPFYLWIQKECEQMHALLTDIKSTLVAIKNACELGTFGDQLTPDMILAADDLYHMRIPRTWCALSGHSAPPQNYPLGQWLTSLTERNQHFEKIIILGREKMPAYWLGAFFNPKALLALLKQDSHKHYSVDRSGSVEPFVFQTEITARDKDHLRDPPQEGMFVFGLYMWGCAWEKTTGELLDLPPKHGCTPLPVVHITCWPQSEKPNIQDPTRAAETYACPLFHSRTAPRDPIMEIDVRRENIPATRWALRGLSATIRPY